MKKFSLRKFIIQLMPIILAEFLAPYIGTIDSIGKGTYYRLYDSKKHEGAGLLIRRS
jgi:hypothetical protein